VIFLIQEAQKMTLEQIQKKKAEIIELEKKLLQQQKEKERKQKKQQQLKQRKLETRVKIIIGGNILKNWESQGRLDDMLARACSSPGIRDQDWKALDDYRKAIKERK